MAYFGGAVDPAVKNDIKKSLNAFERASRKVAQSVHLDARHDPILHEALNTRPVTMNNNPGVQVGNFAVFSIPNASGKARYDIANMTTGEKLIGGMHLAEAAHAIVKLLNRKYSFYSPQVKTLLEHEQNYQKHYADAVAFKRKIQNNPGKDGIFETRFEEAKRSASIIKESVNQFVARL